MERCYWEMKNNTVDGDSKSGEYIMKHSLIETHVIITETHVISILQTAGQAITISVGYLTIDSCVSMIS